jgi:hypothetical protein
MPSNSWYAFWIAVSRIVDADPELAPLRQRYERLSNGSAGSPAHKRAEREYLRLRQKIEDRAKEEVAAAEVDREREDKAAYMRDYRASKRAAREAVDASRTVTPTED